MNVEEKLKTIIEKANQQIALKTEEKEAIRTNVVSFMKAHPILVAPQQPAATFLSWAGRQFQMPVLRYATLAALALVVFAGGAVSYAAQYALPGDALYSVKVGVNEKVLSFVAFSDERRAEYDVSLAQKRLEEMETVVAMDGENDTKTAQVKKLLDKHIANATAHAERISQKKQPEVSAQIHSEIEASLQGHERVLDALALVPGKEAKHKKTVDTFVSDLKNSTKEAMRARENTEKELTGNTATETSDKAKVPAQNRLEAAKETVAEFTALVANANSAMNTETKEQANEAIRQANALIAQGEVTMNLGGYASAFANFQQAIRIIREARIHTNAEVHFNINILN